MDYPIEVRRHSAAHVMAAAIHRLFPKAKFGVGPVIENGFYYDIDIGRPLAEDEISKISDEMNTVVAENPSFVRQEISLDEAMKLFESLNQPYKVELLRDLKTKGTTKVSAEEAQEVDPQNIGSVSIYKTGEFVDLCRGPHVAEAKEIGVWKLVKTSGAYWRGKEGNAQMQRIYGWCFATEEELKAFQIMMEEAEKRDHKKLGPELDLFTFSDLVGPGLPLWTPRGTLLRNILDDFVWQLRAKHGYERVEIPHITKKDLYERSGHWEKYKDDLFKITTREGHEFAMKPMNCPHHTQIYARRLWSYRELPQRYANTTMCYRDEQSGELSGLSRVRGFTQDDAHVFCRMSQVKEEFLKVWDVIQDFYRAFGFSLRVRLSLHDPAHPEKYLGNPERWHDAEGVLREIVNEKKVDWFEGVGEAAFYGPKLDFMAKDSIGRDWQVATIQLDMNMPERFDLVCINEGGDRERIVMIHCAIMGSIERFLSIAIEHFAGAFPLWMAPIQVSVLPVADRHVLFAQTLANELSEHGIRTSVDESSESVGKKIRQAEKLKVPRMLVVGDKEANGGELTVRTRGEKDQAMLSKDKFIEQTLHAIRERLV
ncbi:MAG TPA: threonine--tRNA ligase [Patescibacteria group bacterium]|nr:threonine--tRNA ligase [Patescibacteria group bacterium]